MMTIHPADGLINRLLQQNSRPSNAESQNVAPSKREVKDSVHISSAARNQEAPSQEVPSPDVQRHAGERQLESQLLQLYRSNAHPER